MGDFEVRILALEARLEAAVAALAAAEARLAAAEQQQWQAWSSGGGGGGGQEFIIVRVTTQANAATAPAYSVGAGVVQVDSGSSPYADDSTGYSVSFKSDHDKNIVVGAHAKLLPKGDDWWVVDVAGCGDLS